jgi:hypothetical protein
MSSRRVAACTSAIWSDRAGLLVALRFRAGKGTSPPASRCGWTQICATRERSRPRLMRGSSWWRSSRIPACRGPSPSAELGFVITTRVRRPEPPVSHSPGRQGRARAQQRVQRAPGSDRGGGGLARTHHPDASLLPPRPVRNRLALRFVLHRRSPLALCPYRDRGKYPRARGAAWVRPHPQNDNGRSEEHPSKPPRAPAPETTQPGPTAASIRSRCSSQGHGRPPPGGPSAGR